MVIEWEWRHTGSKPMGYGKGGSGGGGKYIANQASLKKKKIEKSQIDQLTLYLRELEKKQQMKLKPRTRRERIKIGAEISELEIKWSLETI